MRCVRWGGHSPCAPGNGLAEASERDEQNQHSDGEQADELEPFPRFLALVPVRGFAVVGHHAASALQPPTTGNCGSPFGNSAFKAPFYAPTTACRPWRGCNRSGSAERGRGRGTRWATVQGDWRPWC